MDGASLKQLPPLCDSHIRIDADGHWWHGSMPNLPSGQDYAAISGEARSRLVASLQTPITRPELVKLFSSILWKENDDYLLVTPVERCTVEVEDLPFIAVDVERKDGIITATLNIDEKVEIGSEHALGFDEKGPWIALWRGLRARLSRPAYYRLAEWAEENHDGGEPAWYVTSHATRFRLGG